MLKKFIFEATFFTKISVFDFQSEKFFGAQPHLDPNFWAFQTPWKLLPWVPILIGTGGYSQGSRFFHADMQCMSEILKNRWKLSSKFQKNIRILGKLSALTIATSFLFIQMLKTYDKCFFLYVRYLVYANFDLRLVRKFFSAIREFSESSPLLPTKCAFLKLPKVFLRLWRV